MEADLLAPLDGATSSALPGICLSTALQALAIKQVALCRSALRDRRLGAALCAALLREGLLSGKLCGVVPAYDRFVALSRGLGCRGGASGLSGGHTGLVD